MHRTVPSFLFCSPSGGEPSLILAPSLLYPHCRNTSRGLGPSLGGPSSCLTIQIVKIYLMNAIHLKFNFIQFCTKTLAIVPVSNDKVLWIPCGGASRDNPRWLYSQFAANSKGQERSSSKRWCRFHATWPRFVQCRLRNESTRYQPRFYTCGSRLRRLAWQQQRKYVF